MAKIPVYQLTIPEYKLKKFRKTSKKIEYAGTPWFNIKIPKIYEDNKPDFVKIGTKIDKCLRKHFLGHKVAIRALSSREHKGKSINDMVKIIKKLGTDRYNPKRKGDRYTNIENKQIDFFAISFIIREKGEYARQFVEPFYYWPIYDRETPVRIDILILYDLSQLKTILHQYKGREGEIKRDGFIFKYPDRKSDAVRGIIKIL